MQVIAKCRQSMKKIAIDSEQGSGRTAQKPCLVSSTVGPLRAQRIYRCRTLRAQCISVQCLTHLPVSTRLVLLVVETMS